MTMIVYRVQCASHTWRYDATQFHDVPGTGHGVCGYEHQDCDHRSTWFGYNGSPPDTIEDHELCFTSAEQFPRWISQYRKPGEWRLESDWEIAAFEIDPAEVREDNGQLVADPVWASYLGPVTFEHVLSQRKLVAL